MHFMHKEGDSATEQGKVAAWAPPGGDNRFNGFTSTLNSATEFGNV